jgi:subtilisin family serine protease
VVVAVLDSGIRYTHEDLAGNLWVNPGEIPGNGLDDDQNGIVDDIYGFNAVNDTGDPMDDYGHGTHVAGVIGATGNNGKGVAGVAWRVKIMSCKLLDSQGDGDTSDAIQAIDYAREMGATIMNASWGSSEYPEGMEMAIRKARNQGIIFVTAAGNEAFDNDSIPNYPSNFDLDNIVVVGATSRSDAFETSYSNYGKTTVDLAAPGSAIYSTWHTSDGAYTYLSGTSMAAPLVTGAFALLKAKFPNENEIQLIHRVLESVDPLPDLKGKCVTGGRLNLQRALSPQIAADFSFSPPAGPPPLSVQFSNTSRGGAVSWLWDFGDDSPPSTEQNPMHEFLSSGEFAVRLIATDAYGNSSQKEATVLAAHNATVQQVAHEWREPSDDSVIDLVEGSTVQIQIPFDFEFYGTQRHSIFVGTDGILAFSDQNLLPFPTAALPSPEQPNGIIAPFWANLQMGESGSVHVEFTGDVPHRQCIVSWLAMVADSGDGPFSFQVALEESSDRIRFNYRQVQPDWPGQPLVLARSGIERPGGLMGVSLAQVFEGVIPDESSVEFKPFPRIAFDAEPLEPLIFSSSAGYLSKRILLSNTGNVDARWKCLAGADWLSIQPAEGTLRPGETSWVEVSADASMAPGTYVATLTAQNELDGAVALQTQASLVIEEASILSISESSPWKIQGKFGGAFSPETHPVTIRNTGTGSMIWSLAFDPAWFEASQNEGLLEPGESVEISVLLAAGIKSMHSGVHEKTLSFHNLSGSQEPVMLPISVTIEGNLHFSSTGSNDETSVTFELSGERGVDYSIEQSEDLQSWEPFSAVTAGDDNTISITAPRLEGGKRFFRARKKAE